MMSPQLGGKRRIGRQRRIGDEEAELERYLRAHEASRKRVAECGVFDIKRDEFGLRREVPTVLRPCPFLVSVYARLGLHRYNLLEDKNLQFSRVSYYVKTTPLCAATYYITLDAMDPTSRSCRTLQTSVSENSLGQLMLACDIARIRGEPETSDYSGPIDKYLNLGCLPELPPENPFANSKRYCVVNEVEDWIRLYLELAVATNYMGFDDTYNLEILKVAIETMEDVNEGPNADSVIVVYIKYKDLCEARVGKDVDRVAIIRRRSNGVTGWFSLEGQILSLEEVVPKIVALVANEEDTGLYLSN